MAENKSCFLRCKGKGDIKQPNCKVVSSFTACPQNSNAVAEIPNAAVDDMNVVGKCVGIRSYVAAFVAAPIG